MMTPEEAREWELHDREVVRTALWSLAAIFLFGLIAIGTFTFALCRSWGLI